MRTTLTLHEDVADKVKQAAHRRQQTLKQIINEALRLGLERLDNVPESLPYATQPRPMGLRAGLAYDNVADLLARAEGEDFR